jgi:hypothetical protein
MTIDWSKGAQFFCAFCGERCATTQDDQLHVAHLSPECTRFLQVEAAEFLRATCELFERRPVDGSRWKYRGWWVGVVDLQASPGKVRCCPEHGPGSEQQYDWPLAAFLRCFEPVSS